MAMINTLQIYWLLFPFLIYSLAFGGVILPKINLIMELVCRDYLSDRARKDPDFTYLPIVFGQQNDQCAAPEVQSRVAIFTLWANLVLGVLSAIMSPILGSLSDRYGRLRILTITSAGTLIGELLTITAARNPETFTISWLFLGYISEGLCGSFTAAMAISNCYAADCTPPHKRNIAFGYFHGCLFTGIAVGPLLAGSIIKATGSLLLIFYLGLGAHLLFITTLAFIIPESLSRKRQMFARENHAQNALKHAGSAWSRIRRFNIFAPLKILWPTGEGSSPRLRRNLALLAAVDTIMFGVAMGSMTVVIIYSRSTFHWDVFQQSTLR